MKAVEVVADHHVEKAWWLRACCRGFRAGMSSDESATYPWYAKTTGRSRVNSESKPRSDRPCGCSSLWLQSHQVGFSGQGTRNEQIHSGQRRNVASAGHDYIGFNTAVVGSPPPDTDARRAVLDRCVHVEVLQCWLLPRDRDVDVVTAAQAVVHDRQ